MNRPPHPSVPGSSKTRWAALLVLVVVLLAMGATLIRIQSRPVEPRLVVLPQRAQAPMAQAKPEDRGWATKMPESLSEKAQDATVNEANKAAQITGKPRPVAPRTPEPAVARPPVTAASAAPIPAAQ